MNLPDKKSQILEKVVKECEERKLTLLYCTLVGSHAYGNATPQSDVDVRFVFAAPANFYLGFGGKDSLTIETEDVFGYEFIKWSKLLTDNNPTVLETLFMEKESVLYMHPVMEHFFFWKHEFLSKKCFNTYLRYAEKQLYKAKSCTKEVVGKLDWYEKILTDNGVDVEKSKISLKEVFRSVPISFKTLDNDLTIVSTLGYLLDEYNSFKQSQFPYSDLGQKRREYLRKFGFDCYDDITTQFLTDVGWKRYDEISSNNKLATVNIISGITEFQDFTSRTDVKYTGNLYTINCNGSKTSITGNHNCLISNTHRKPSNNFSVAYIEEKSDWQLVPLVDLLRGKKCVFHYRKVGNAVVSTDYDVSDEYLILAGLYVSEGSTHFHQSKKFGKKVKSVHLSQVKDGKFIELAEHLLSYFGGGKTTHKRANKNNYEITYFFGKEIAQKIYSDFGHKENKHLPSWVFNLSERQIKLFWEALVSGDGTVGKKNTVYYTTLPTLADQIQALLVLAGLPAVVYGPYESMSSYTNSTLVTYQVVVPHTSNIATFYTSKSKIFDKNVDKVGKPYGDNIIIDKVVDRRVVCFDVPNSTLITRNSGKPAVHGNSKNMSHAIRLGRTCYDIFDKYELKVRRNDAQDFLDIKNGKYSLDELEAEFKHIYAETDFLYHLSHLPDEPNKDFVERLSVDVLKKVLLNG